MNETAIDWLRITEPQANGYDTAVALRLAKAAGYVRPESILPPTLLDGAVSTNPDRNLMFPGECRHADPTHPNIQRADALLKLWPEVFDQCCQLLDNITLFQHTDHPSDFVIGSICGPGTRGFGSIAVTVDNHIGFVEGIVHELAHHKLAALGVNFESADQLLLNDPESLYPSPIRYDCMRPMTAVLHAQYSYTYILQLDLKILDARLDSERDRQIVEHSIAVIAPKLEFGAEVLQQDAQLDKAGERFLEGLLEWSARIRHGCEQWLTELHIEKIPFQHPLMSAERD